MSTWRKVTNFVDRAGLRIAALLHFGQRPRSGFETAMIVEVCRYFCAQFVDPGSIR
jgi:hypothetical protein